jgi:5-formyltetrahydrofolate cyclo-ligase
MDAPGGGKTDMRKRLCALRELQDPRAVEELSAALCARLAEWPPLVNAHTVLGYLAFRNELDVRPLFGLLSHIRWAVPRVSGRQLVIHPYDPERLVRHRFGMLEPDPRLPVIGPEELDVVLVPGVAFDPQGGRLGYGGGYYDRLLPTTRALRVGIAADTSVVECLPCGDLDARMDWIATPSQIIPCARTCRPA